MVVAFGLALGDRWGDVGRDLTRLTPGIVILAFLLALLGVLLSYLAWRVILSELGSDVGVRSGAKVFFVGQLGKYVPGSVWPVVVQMRMGTALGVPRSRIGFAFVIVLGLSVAWGLLIGLAAVPSLLAGTGGAYVWLLALLPVAALFLHPRPVNALLGMTLRLLRRPPLQHRLSGRGILRASAALVGFWLVAGLHVWVLAVDLGAPRADSLAVSIGGFALAFCVGPLVVVAPAGAGVREAVLVVVLGAVLPIPSAVAVALVSRLLLVLVDGLLAGAALVADRTSGTPA